MPVTSYAARLKAKLNRYEPLIILIRGTMLAKRLIAEDLCEETGLSLQSIYNRFKRPQDFRLSELSGVARRLGIPWEDILKNIPE